MEPSPDHEHEKIERLRRAMYSRELSGKLKDRPRHMLEDIRPMVGEEWKHKESGVPSSTVAPRTIGAMRTVLRYILGASIVFFLGAAGFFGYYFTLGGGASPASSRNIDIVISGPAQISGGEPTQLQITVTNRNPMALQLADLVIIYPSGTRSPAAQPEDTQPCSRAEGTEDSSYDFSRQRVCLGTIEPGGRRQGTVSAIFSGSDGDSANVIVDLEYRLEGSSAIFVASSEYSATFSASALSVAVEGNSETISGQPVEFTVTVASNVSVPVNDALLSAGFPFGFTLSGASPMPAGGNVWELGDIGPGQRKQIVIRGTLTGESGDERVFRFTAGTRNSPEEEGITTPIVESPFTMRVAEPFFGLNVLVNGRTGTGVVVAPGETVNVAIHWQNNLSTAIADAVIVARLTGIQIDGALVKSPDGFFRSTDGAVLWDRTTTGGDFSQIVSGAKGAVTFSFRVPSGTELEAVRNPSLTITVNAAGKRVSEEGVPENLQATAVQRIALASALTVTAQGLYYANPFGSVGPLPPKAGTETTYAVVFTLTNTTNEISSAKLVATLPPYVRWTGIFSPGSENLTFNQNNGTVTWDVGTVGAGVGVGGTPPRQAAIAIGFTPSTSQIGQEPPLLLGITLTGVDSAGTPVSRSVQNVSTNIIGDPGFNSTQATVIK